ncbi:unnamed protein product [Nesidiocoris tenuis]|uniref:Flavin-containing monooxygenase n=1 Tax=Nesidiocoris tenuis TaxID=355587 RepID=A0A6H5GAS2_9HEMI|nr:unnamed protein product [Nesidiocoris tenuis]
MPTRINHQLPNGRDSVREIDPAKLIAEGCCHVPGNRIPKIAIIGAGPAGLCAARHVFAENSGCTGKLRLLTQTTNLPKESMEYLDFPYNIDGKSYLTSEEVLGYLHKYADHFNLMPHIKLNHLVKTVAPVGKRWSVLAVDQETQIEHVSLYDAVMVCSGALKDFENFRYCQYKIIDDANFEVELLERPPPIVPASHKAVEKPQVEPSVQPEQIGPADVAELNKNDETDTSLVEDTSTDSVNEQVEGKPDQEELTEIVEKIEVFESKSEKNTKFEETNEHFETSISTIQTVLATADDLNELIEKFGSNLEKVETTVSQTVESSVTRQTIEELTTINDEGVSVSTITKSSESKSSVQGEAYEVVEKSINGDQQLREGIRPLQNQLEAENSPKQR